MHNCCISGSLDYLKSYFKFKSRLVIPEFSGSHCFYYNKGTVCVISSESTIKEGNSRLTMVPFNTLTNQRRQRTTRVSLKNGVKIAENI